MHLSIRIHVSQGSLNLVMELIQGIHVLHCGCRNITNLLPEAVEGGLRSGMGS